MKGGRLLFLGYCLLFHPAGAQEMRDLPTPVDHGLEAIHKDMNTHIGPPEVFSLRKTTSATFNVTYNGFSPQAQTAFQHAVDIWASLLVSPVPINVTANFTSLPPNVLGSAGAGSVTRDFPGATFSNTWYAISLAEELAGIPLNFTNPDINANFSSSFSNWYFGTDGNTPSGKYDFVSVVLHELGHGLGFSGSMSNDSTGEGSWGLSGFPIIYDLGSENGSGQSLLNTGAFPNPSFALGAQLTSDDVFFDGTEAFAAAGGTFPKLYTPSVWKSGSSYSHLDEATYPAGDENSLMTFALGTAESIHSPGPIALAMFRDMGWVTTDVTDIGAGHPGVVTEFRLKQNYPNPFNPSTTIAFTVGSQQSAVSGQGSMVRLTVYDLLGREVATLVNGDLSPGSYAAQFNGANLSSGTYLYRLEAGGKTEVKRMVLLR